MTGVAEIPGNCRFPLGFQNYRDSKNSACRQLELAERSSLSENIVRAQRTKPFQVQSVETSSSRKKGSSRQLNATLCWSPVNIARSFGAGRRLWHDVAKPELSHYRLEVGRINFPILSLNIARSHNIQETKTLTILSCGFSLENQLRGTISP